MLYEGACAMGFYIPNSREIFLAPSDIQPTTVREKGLRSTSIAQLLTVWFMHLLASIIRMVGACPFLYLAHRRTEG